MATSLPSFAYTAPTIVWFAPDGLGRLASYLKRLGVTRALLVCDPGVEAQGIADRVAAAAGGRIAARWTQVEADAPRASVHAGSDEARRCAADGVVAVGGGSSIDSGKAIALLAARDPSTDVARWEGANQVGAPGLPLVAIPTTAGTGSEVSNILVVKDAAAARKLVVIDRAVYPQVAILDPGLTVGLPPALTAATGVDALTHAVEGVVSTYRQPVCDAIGLECVRLIRAWLPRAVGDGGDLEARGTMLLAASMAGQLVSLTFSGVAHAVAHALGIGWGAHHGAANAVTLPFSIRWNARHPEAAAMYARCAGAFGLRLDGSDGDRALAFADALERWIAGLGLPTRLGALGVGATDEELARLAALAFADPSHRPNPVAVPDAAALAEALRPLR